MKKLYYLIVLTLILGLVLTGCLLSNVGQVPTSEQSGITYLTKNPGPVLAARWNFDEGSGTTAYDSSVNVNDGDINGATWVADQWGGYALSFNGNEYVEVPDHSSLDITGSITVEGWIKLTSFSPQATVAGKWKDIGGTSQRGYLLTVGTDGKPRFYISTTGANYPVAVGSTLSLNTWYHLAGTWDGTNIKVYVDTTSASTSQTGSIFSNDQPLLIGANDGWGGSNRKFTNGVIDEVRIWDGALTVDQIGDISPPEVTINAPADGGFYPVGAVPIPDFTVVDANSYTVEETGYSTDEGVHTYTVTATDVLGYEGSASVTYYVLENFVTGGGKINKSTLNLPGKGAALTFAGTIGVLEGEGIVGQFQIVDHASLLREGKGAVSLHCNNFTYLEFNGEEAESPEATHDTAIFEGEFTSNRGDTETLLLRIIDNGEKGAGVDTVSLWFWNDWVEWTIDGGNFQVHDIE